jgi:hypothetical protein
VAAWLALRQQCEQMLPVWDQVVIALWQQIPGFLKIITQYSGLIAGHRS